MDISQKLVKAIGELDDALALDLVRQMNDSGYTQQDIIDCLNKGVAQVGIQFEQGEYFIADLIVSGMIYRDVLNIVMQGKHERTSLPIGRIVIGVVAGDIHDIGKDIIVSILRAEHFEVIDLGVDVKPERFAYALRTYLPDVLVLSGVLTIAQESMKKTIELIEKEGLRQGTPIFIGGLCANEYVKDTLQVDGWAYETSDTVNFCKKVVQEKYVT